MTAREGERKSNRGEREIQGVHDYRAQDLEALRVYETRCLAVVAQPREEVGSDAAFRSPAVGVPRIV